MSGFSNCSELLEKLGLTPLQAKIYLLLLQTPKKTLSIAKAAETDRSNTHRTIIHLQNKGIIKKIIGIPAYYQALPLQEAGAILLNTKQAEYQKIEEAAEKLQRIQLQTKENRGLDDLITVEMMTQIKRLRHIKTNNKKLENEFKTINVSTKILDLMLFLKNENLDALKKGIKYRIITSAINKKTLTKKLNAFMDEPNFQLKFINQNPRFWFSIWDKKTLHFGRAETILKKETCYCSTDKGLIDIFQSHYDKVWNEAKPLTSDKRQKYKISKK